jgi:hypothetical protein
MSAILAEKASNNFEFALANRFQWLFNLGIKNLPVIQQGDLKKPEK